jgi:predicted phosphoribosyltransferase
MIHQIRQHLESRRHAGQLLAEKLAGREFANAIVYAVPRGGIPVGQEIAAALGIPLEIVFSKRIRHPAHGEQSIGAVSLDEVILHESTQFIPQSYVLSQITSLQRLLQQQFHQYYGERTRKNITGKTVILTDDVLRDLDELTACLATLERQRPHRVVVAAAVVSRRIMNYLREQDIAIYYLFSEVGHQSKPYTYFPAMNDAETREIFRR